MRILIAIGMLMATTVAAYAFNGTPVPEIDAFAGMASVGAPHAHPWPLAVG